MADEQLEAFNPTEEARFEEARFRYGVISKLIQGEVPPGEVAETVRQLAAQEWTDPQERQVRFSERTIYNWLKQYRDRGFAGLLRQRRSDKGKVRAFSQATLEELVRLREDPPHRSTAAVLDIFERDNQPPVVPTRSTVDRHLDRLGKSRRRLGILKQKVREPIVIERVNQLWVGDLHDGPKVLHPVFEVPVETHLSAFIDHRSRRVPFGQYYLAENLAVLEDSFRRSIGRGGCPELVYVDNAKIYQSKQFEIACLRLGIHPPIHSKPYDKESRGVIERFNGTVKQDFEREVRTLGRLLTLEELNEYWWAWLEEKYHRRVHEVTGRAPLDFWEADGFVPRYADPDVLAECFRIHAPRVVNRKTSSVAVSNLSYKVDPEFRDRTVDVFYDPFDRKYVVIYFRTQRIQRAYQKERKPPATEEEDSPKTSQVPYLDMLNAAHQRRLRQEAAELAYRDLPSEGEGFSDFVEAFQTVFTAPVDQSVHGRLERFWNKYGPVPMDLTKLVLGDVLACGQVDLHVNHYLEHLRRRLRTRPLPDAGAESQSRKNRKEQE